MDVQQALLSRMIHDGAISQVVNARITSEFFPDDRWRRVFERCLDHWRKFATPPDLAVIQGAFPSYQFPDFDQSLDYFIEELRQRRKRVILTSALSEAAGFIHLTDEPDAMDMLADTLREALIKVRLETTPTTDVSVFDSYERILERLDDRAENPGFLRGISTGFDGIDYVTGGLQPEQFVVVIGLPKSFKSSTALMVAKAIHRQLKFALFIGFEMSNEEQEDRLASLYAEVGLTKILHGKFTYTDRKRIERSFRTLSDAWSVPLMLSVDMDSAMTVSGVQAKITEYHPDVVIIDGAYLMQSEIAKVEQGSAQALTDIARELKKLAQTHKIAIVVTTQASETRSRGGKLTAASAMYTQAWRQSADVLLGTERVEQDADDDSGAVMVRFKVLASRGGPRAETVLAWDWNKGTVTEMDPGYFKQAAADSDD